MNRQRSGWKRIWDAVLWTYCWLIVLTFLYVLSIGPMFWVWYDAINFGEPVSVAMLYAPLTAACESSETVDELVTWYIGLWT